MVNLLKNGNGNGRDKVAIILAIGFATALNCLTVAVLYDAIFSDQSGLSENATQIITGAFGGVIGILGVMLGEQKASHETSSIDNISNAAVPSDDTNAV